MLLYHKTNFDFSQEAKDWLLNRYKDHFKLNFYHNYDWIQNQLQHEWRASIAGEELLSYLSQYNCDTSNLIITAHLANLTIPYYSRPHVDAEQLYGPAKGKITVTSKFNIIVLGNPEDPMLWWTNFHHTDKRLYYSNVLNTRTNQEFSSLSMPGHTNEEKMEYLGPATDTASNLLTPSAFVRTDYVHTVHLSPGPRLVITVGFEKSIEDLIN